MTFPDLQTTPRTPRDPRVAAYGVLLVLSTGIAFFSAATMLATRERFLRLFADFGAALPAVTQGFASPWVPTLLVTIAILTLLKEALPGLRGVSVLWNALVLLASLTVLGLYVTSMFATLMGIMRTAQ